MAIAEPAMTDPDWLGLICHPSTHRPAVRAIQVLVRRPTRAELRITYRLDGVISRILLPSPNLLPIPTELWRHTCFEAFIAIAGQTAYYEFNFAPSCESAVYAFRGYRDGGPLANEILRPSITVRSTPARLELDALVRLDRLSAIHANASLRIGLSAVIETGDGFSYWALRHPPGKPDFHHDDGFVLLLQPPDLET